MALTLQDVLKGFAQLKQFSEERERQYTAALSQALKVGRIFPFLLEEQERLQTLQALRKHITAPKTNFIAVQAYARMKPEVDQKITALEANLTALQDIYNTIDRHIELEVMPNPLFDGERIYLAQGRVFMPTTIRTPGYHAFRIKTCTEHSSVILEPLTEYGVDSLEKVMEQYFELNVLGTVAVARNTEHYDLQGAALPIVQKKYERGLFGE